MSVAPLIYTVFKPLHPIKPAFIVVILLGRVKVSNFTQLAKAPPSINWTPSSRVSSVIGQLIKAFLPILLTVPGTTSDVMALLHKAISSISLTLYPTPS